MTATLSDPTTIRVSPGIGPLASDNHLLRIEGLVKKFPGVDALKGVSFELFSGEILGLVGENGAGKSTLAKIVGGLYHPDEGGIAVNGQTVRFSSPRDALAHGVALIHQEIQVFPNLSIAENLFIDNLPIRQWTRAIRWATLERAARSWLEQLNLSHLNPRTPMSLLGPAERQLVEIARSLLRQPRILLMDEPTTALSRPEIDRLFGIVRNLRAQGVSVIFISHHIVDVLSLCDRLVVLRDGLKVGEHRAQEVSLETVVQEMVGRDIKEMYPKVTVPVGPVVLEAKHVGLKSRGLQDVSLNVRQGEIVGVTGLLGSGKTSLADCIFGVLQAEEGTGHIDGIQYSLRQWSPARSLARHIGYIPEDRKERGLVLPLSVGHNISLTILGRLTGILGAIRRHDERQVVDQRISELSIKTPSSRRPVRFLSGGNQQKVVLAKWLSIEPHVLIMDEPTKGIDVGAKAEVYSLLSNFIAQRGAALLFSSEIPELLALCDRIYVLYRGRVAGCLERRDATEELVGQLATGVRRNHG